MKQSSLCLVISLISAFGLGYTLPTLLGAKPVALTKLSAQTSTANNNLVTQTPLASSNSVTGLLRLEVSLSRHQVTLYQGAKRIRSYPVAVGRSGWETPKGHFQVIELWKNPIWIHPLTGQVIPSDDPRNPLGAYWIAFWTDGRNWVGFHGTPDSNSVGKASSHGCLRMYNKDIEQVAHQVSFGTPVNVVE